MIDRGRKSMQKDLDDHLQKMYIIQKVYALIIVRAVKKMYWQKDVQDVPADKMPTEKYKKA